MAAAGNVDGRSRLRLALVFARSVEPRSLPASRAPYADGAHTALGRAGRLDINRGGVLAARLAVPGEGKTAALVVASAPLAARRRYPQAACPLLVPGCSRRGLTPSRSRRGKWPVDRPARRAA